MSTLALCIPAYNAAWCLPRLLTSANNQVIPFDEIWVYNDCSSDDTSSIAKAYGANVLEGDVNRGCSVGKNRLLEVIQSKWVHFHDADDELLPNFTTLAHRWMAQPTQPDVVLFDYECRNQENNIFLGARKFNNTRLEADPISYAIEEQINPFCGLYRTSKLKEVGGYDTDPEILYNEDVAFHCKLAIKGLTFSSDDTIAIVNYQVSTSMSSTNQIKCIRAQYKVMEAVSEQTLPLHHKSITNRLWQIIGVAGAYDDWDTVKSAIHLAYRLSGNNMPAQGFAFKIIANLNPLIAVKLREYFIRLFKPHLRQHLASIQ